MKPIDSIIMGVIAGTVLAVVAIFFTATRAKAEDCPKGAQACKVVIMTPEEIATLTQPGGILDQAIWASRSTMTSLAEAWKKKIETSPNGTVKAEDQK